MLKLVVALLFVFTIDNSRLHCHLFFQRIIDMHIYLMHFKGSTDLVNSAKLYHFEAFLYIYTIVIMNRSQVAAALLLYYRRKKIQSKVLGTPL